MYDINMEDEMSSKLSTTVFKYVTIIHIVGSVLLIGLGYVNILPSEWGSTFFVYGFLVVIAVGIISVFSLIRDTKNANMGEAHVETQENDIEDVSTIDLPDEDDEGEEEVNSSPTDEETDEESDEN